MKEIKNWEAIIVRDGIETLAIPLPGCLIKGELDGDVILVEALDINLSQLIVTISSDIKYRLSGAREDYLTTLNQFIEIGKEKNIEINLDFESLCQEKNEGVDR